MKREVLEEKLKNLYRVLSQPKIAVNSVPFLNPRVQKRYKKLSRIYIRKYGVSEYVSLVGKFADRHKINPLTVLMEQVLDREGLSYET